ncbi:MAG: PQQ-dependent sugar dehydrogenase, partial [Candidatus Limnocylindrales bacterium]
MTIQPAPRLPLLVLATALLVGCGPTAVTTPPPGTSASPSNVASRAPGSTAPTRAPRPDRTPAPTASTPVAGPSFNVNLSVELFATAFPPLTFITNAGDGSGLLYAVGQNGVISVLSLAGEVQPVPFLDIDDRVRSGGEQGLLGLAFHPDFESNWRLFVNYTNNDGDTVVSEFSRLSGQPGSVFADPGSERVLLTIDQPYANHNGGMIAFGPDGDLYIGMGDGGSAGDPMGNGQAP